MALTKQTLKSNIYSFLDGIANEISTSALKGVPVVGDLDLPVGQAMFSSLKPLIDNAIENAGPDLADLVEALDNIDGIDAALDGNDIAIRVFDTEKLSLVDETFNEGASAGGIGLNLDGKFKTDLTAAIDVKLKVDGTSGDLSIVDPGNTKELSLQLTSDLKAAASGNLGFLSIEVKDKATTPEINLSASIDLKAGKVADAFAAPIAPVYKGTSSLDLGITTKVLDGRLPSIGAELVMNYDFVTQKQNIAFKHVSLDIGSLLGSFSGVFATLGSLRDTFPLGIILDIATGKLPLVDSLAHDVPALFQFLNKVPSIKPDDKITLADLAVIYDGLQGAGIGKYFDGLATIALVLGIAKQLGGKTLDLDLGGFNVADDPTKSIDAFTGLLPSEAKSTFDDLVNQLTSGSSTGSGLSSKDGLTIPILDDPSLIVKLLLNALYPNDPVTIVQYDVPDLDYSVGESLTLDFPILGPIGLTLEGDAAVAIDIGIGYDSLALKTGKFEDGIFFTNFDDAGNPSSVPIVHLTAGIHAGVVLNAVVLRASVTGGITFNIDGNLRGLIPDSKSRLSEVGSFPIFPTGKAAADVRVRLRIGFGAFSYSKTIPLVSVVLVDFSLSGNGQGPSSPPNEGLATLTGTNLQLNTGPRAGTRVLNNIKGNDATDLEAYQIGFAVNMQGVVIPGALAISAFGTTQVFGAPGAGPLTITGDLGQGNDSLIVSADVTQAINVHGGADDDMIVGGKGADTIYGDGGNDYLVGNDGDDVIFGGDEDDAKGEGDTLIGGAGADRLNGGKGFDTVTYVDAKQTVGVRLQKVAGIAEIAGFGGEAEGDRLTGIDQLTGTEFNDTLTANDDASGAAKAPRTLDGLGGNDNLIGGEGDDTLIGGTGGDFLSGGGGAHNVAGYIASWNGVTINLATKVFYGGDADGDWLVNIQDIYGSGFGDNLTGDGASNTLSGFLGNDTLDGGAGQDTVSGGQGDDIVYGHGDGDTLDGGGLRGDREIDLLSYRFIGVNAGITVDLKAGTASRKGNPFYTGTDTIVGEKAEVPDASAPDGVKTVDVAGYSSFENLEGTDNATVGDSLTGDDGDNTIWGLAGADTINGGNGNDHLIGGLGADTMDGGDGYDWAEYRDSTVQVTAYLDGTTGAGPSGGTAVGDVLTNIENLLGSDQSDDLFGNAGDNVIDPGLSRTGTYEDDYVEGRAGTDTLQIDYSRSDIGQGFIGGFTAGSSTDGYAERRDKTGNAIMDAVTFLGIERLRVTSTRMSDTVYAGAGNDVIVTNSGNDTILAGTGSDYIDAGDGDDTVTYGNDVGRSLSLGAGNDTFYLDGGTGIDTLSLAVTVATANITLSGHSTEFTGINLVLDSGAAIKNFETLKNVWTGSGNDSITQSGKVDNDFRTGDGVDIIRPGLGFDTVDGGIDTTGLVLTDAANNWYEYQDVDAYQASRGDTLVLDYSSVTDAAVSSYTTPQNSSYVIVPSGNTPLTNSGLYRTVATNGTVTNSVSYSEIERLDVTGSRFADVLAGTDNDPGKKSGDDVLRGMGGDDLLLGYSGNDTLIGGDGNDELQGSVWADRLGQAVANVFTPYEIDTLTGGAGADTFVLGDAQRAHYFYARKGGGPNTNYAIITDFNPAEDDTLRLHGKVQDYYTLTHDGVTDIYYVVPTGGYADDLIATLKGVTSFNLNASYVDYVDAAAGGASAAVAAAAPSASAATEAPTASQKAAAATATASATSAAVAAAAVPTPWITQEADPDVLIAKLGTGSGVVAGSGKLTIEGSGEGFGTFDNDPFGLGSGIILSTGRVADLVGPNTSNGPAGPVSRSIPITFTSIGRAGGSDIYRADLSHLGIDLRSLRLTDGNTKSGGAGGDFSGFDLDAFVLSNQFLGSVSADTNLNLPGTLSRLNAFDYDNAHLSFTPGTQRSVAGGTDLRGSVANAPGSAIVLTGGGRLDNFATDPNNLGDSRLALTLGDGGSLGIDLDHPVSTDGPLYLYIGEYGNPGETVIGSVNVSSDTIRPTGDLSTDLGAPGLAGDTSTMTYTFTPIAGTDLVTFQVVLFSEELPEHGGIPDPDRVKVTLNGISIAALSDGASADLNTLMSTSAYATRPELVLNTPGTGPLASKVSADAYTKTLTFIGRVQAGATNTLVVEAADTRDAYLDTGILIKGGNFLSSGGLLPTNAAPFAVSDAFAVGYNTAFSGNVLTNDVDPNGNALTAALGTGPANGTVTLSSNGAFTYTPKAGFFGNDSFTYKANDGTVNSELAFVDLVVARPSGLVAAAGNPYSATEDTLLGVSASAGVLANDSGAAGATLSAQLVSTTTNGTLALKADGSFTYNPKANFSGRDSFVYRASDGTSVSANVTVVINTAAQNDAPGLTAGAQSRTLIEAGVAANGSAFAGTSTATIALVKGDVDAGDVVTFDASDWTVAGTGKLSKLGTYGSVVLDVGTGVLSYTLDNARPSTNALAAGSTATDVFSVTVTDKAGAVTTRNATFSITGTNDAPLLDVGAQSLTLVEAGIASNGAGNLGTSYATIELLKSDPDVGNTTTFDAAGWTAAGTGKLSKAGLYGTVLLDTATGLLSYTLDNAKAATKALAGGVTVNDAFSVTVKDAAGVTVTKTVSFRIAGSNDAPTITVGAQSRTVIEAGTGVAGVATATIAVGKSDGDTGSATSFDPAGWSSAGSGLLSRNGVYGSVVLDTSTGILTYTLDNARAATNDLETGDTRTERFAVIVRDASGASSKKSAVFMIQGSGDGVTINGSANADTVSATSTAPGQPLPTKYADTILGNDGNDTLAGLGGKDTIDGGAGSDTADYSEKTAAVSVTLNGATNATVTVGGVAEDTIRNIENLIGGSAGDTFTGDGLANTFSGRGGKDVLDGAGGSDTADYAEKTASVAVTLNGATNATVSVGGVAEDTVRNIENLVGGSAGDTFTGDAQANTFSGRGGKDVLDGAGGSDTADYAEKTGAVVVTLNGASIATVSVGGLAEDTVRNIENITSGSGSDTLTGDGLANTLIGNGGNDLLKGAGGGDVLDGGAGSDTADYTEKTTSVSVTLNGATNATVSVGGVAEDTIRNIENLIGGSVGDTFIGDGQSNVFSGRGGNDVMDGGAGVDTANYSEKTASVVVTLNGATNATVSVGGVAEDTVRNIENLIGGSAGDTFIGDALANTFSGRGGKDILDGAGGIDTADYSEKTTSVAVTLNGSTFATLTVGGVAEDTVRNIENLIGGSGGDTLTGDAQANTFSGRAGKDVLDGGAGIDTADYSEKSDSIAVSLNGATGVTVLVGGVGEDAVKNIENITAGGGNDTLNGDWLSNILIGNGGDDLLRGAGGKDTLDGGAGIDTVIYSEKTAAVAVTLNGSANATVSVGGVGEDTIRGFENVWGGTAGDTLTGDGLDNTLSGLAGADTLIGGAGNDTLDGGTEADAMSGGVGDDIYSVDNTGDTVSELSNEGFDTVKTGLSFTLGANVENLILLYDGQSWGLGNALDNIISGNAGNNVLRGYGGNDTLNGWQGADTMTGGIGNDTYFVDTVADVVTELSNEGIDTVKTGLSYTLGANVENLTLIYEGKAWGIGNELGNAMVGNVSDNVLRGMAGNDTLRGMAGNDTLTGGTGADAFVFNTPLNAATNVDTITDFTVSQGDIFWLDDAVFKALAPGALPAGDFVAGTSASNAAQNVIYDSATGSVFYDADGSGAGAQVKFASVTPGTTLSASQFVVI